MLREDGYMHELQINNIPKYALADTHGGIGTTSATSILESNIN